MIDNRLPFLKLLFIIFIILMVNEDGKAQSQHEAIIKDARVFGDNQLTRFVIDIDKAFSPEIFYLQNPNRIAIELPEVRYELSKQSQSGQGLGLIANYRYGLLLGGKSRFILDLSQSAEIAKLEVIEKTDPEIAQIVIDLRAVSNTHFALLAEKSRIKMQPKTRPQQNILSNKSRNDNKFIVVVDAGHGGIDSGALGRKGTKEKDVVLKVAKEIAQSLSAKGGVEVHLTRDRDIFIPLGKRVFIAREKEADLFISVHADAFKQSNVRGATVYTLSHTASDKQAQIIARSENRSDIVAGVDLDEQSDPVSDILIDLMVRETKAFSTLLASKSLNKVSSVTKLHSSKPRSANFKVLRAPDIPSVLIELGYISNGGDESLLNQSAWRKKIAGQIASAVIEYGKATGQYR